MKTLRELANKKNYELRSYNTPLKINEDIKNVITPFDFSNKYGGTFDSFKYYNSHYLYKN